jgi:uncharacterized protein YeaO (DUF488 family)
MSDDNAKENQHDRTAAPSSEPPSSPIVASLYEQVWENEGGRLRKTVDNSASVASAVTVQVGRVYDQAMEQDGNRVLVDRLWPRGISKSRAEIREWCKRAAPSTTLRKWYSHDPQRFAEFRRRYRAELNSGEHARALAHLRELARDRALTLLTASKDPVISGAAVLAELLQEPPQRSNS